IVAGAFGEDRDAARGRPDRGGGGEDDAALVHDHARSVEASSIDGDGGGGNFLCQADVDLVDVVLLGPGAGGRSRDEGDGHGHPSHARSRGLTDPSGHPHPYPIIYDACLVGETSNLGALMNLFAAILCTCSLAGGDDKETAPRKRMMPLSA